MNLFDATGAPTTDWFRNPETLMHFSNDLQMMDVFRHLEKTGNVGGLSLVSQMAAGSGQFEAVGPVSHGTIRDTIFNIVVEGSVIKETDLFNAAINHIQDATASSGDQFASVGANQDFTP